MKKMNPQKRALFLFLCLFTIFAFTATACDLPDLDLGGNDNHREEHPYDPDMPGGENHEEYHPEEHQPEHEEPHPEENHEEPRPEHNEEPLPESEGMQPEEELMADLAITDIYPDNLPSGHLYFRVTNHGPTPLTAYPVSVQCTGFYRRWQENQPEPDDLFSQMEIIVSLASGDTDSFEAGLPIDANLYQYEITCSVYCDIDKKIGNNDYFEVLPPK